MKNHYELTRESPIYDETNDFKTPVRYDETKVFLDLEEVESVFKVDQGNGVKTRLMLKSGNSHTVVEDYSFVMGLF